MTIASEEKRIVPAAGQREWRVDVVHDAALQGAEQECALPGRMRQRMQNRGNKGEAGRAVGFGKVGSSTDASFGGG